MDKRILAIGFAIGLITGLGGIVFIGITMNRPKDLVIMPGACVLEINKQYVAASGEPDTIYKIESAGKRGVSLQLYHPANKGWLFLADKPPNYFAENENFRYENTGCPNAEDGTKKARDLKDVLGKFRFEIGKVREDDGSAEPSPYGKKNKDWRKQEE